MATRKKTIRIPVNFGTPADQASSTTVYTTIGAPTIYIPENSVTNPVTFVSVMLFVAAQDTSTATGGSISVFQAQCQLTGAGSPTNVAISSATLANTAENWSGLFGPIDFTSHFTTNFGTSASSVATTGVGVNVSTGTGTAIRGVYAYYEITYTFEDSEARRIQTICIPYESSTTSLPTTIATYATLKKLTGDGGLLNNYSNLSIKYRWVEIKGNINNNNATTDTAISYNFDGGGATALPTRESGLGSDTYQLYQVNTSGVTTTATHTFGLVSSVTTKFQNIIVNEFVTFEYDVSGTTSVLNYVELNIEYSSPVPGTTSAVDLVFKRNLLIPEPSTIALIKGAVEIDYNTAASATPQISVGSQASYRGYAMVANTTAGMFSFQHGFDSDSALGAGITLTRGENPITISLYRSAGAMTNVSGTIKILYSSGTASSGVDSHTHTVKELQRQMSFTTTADVTVSSDSFAIPEANYWLSSAGFEYYTWNSTATGYITSQARLAAGEGSGDGFRDLYNDYYGTDGELRYTLWNIRARDEFKRYPNDQDGNRMNIETSRNYRYASSAAYVLGGNWTVAYNSITSTVSGSISGSSGGVITLDLYKIDISGDTMFFDTTTITGNSSYSFTVYDDTVDYYVVAYESATYKGVSKQSTPATDFNIGLSPSGSGSTVTTGYGGG